MTALKMLDVEIGNSGLLVVRLGAEGGAQHLATLRLTTGLYFALLASMITPRRFQRDCRFFHLNSGLKLRTWQTTSPAERWRIFCRALFELQTREDFTAHAFVLMGTHFHLLFSTRSPREHILAEDFHQILNQLCNKTLDALETPLFCDPILSAQYYKNAYKYIYRNPLEAGLCRRVEDYEYSSLRGLLGLHTQQVPVIDNLGLVQSPVKMLSWLNQEMEEELTPWYDSIK